MEKWMAKKKEKSRSGFSHRRPGDAESQDVCVCMDARAAFHRRRTPPPPAPSPPFNTHSPSPGPFHCALYESGLAELQYWREFRF